VKYKPDQKSETDQKIPAEIVLEQGIDQSHCETEEEISKCITTTPEIAPVVYVTTDGKESTKYIYIFNINIFPKTEIK
jgi:hypothetical protein